MPESPDDYATEINRRSRKRRRVALVAIGTIALVLLLRYAPDFCIERASKSYVACSNRDYEERPNPETSCESAVLWLVFPKLVPWRRQAAIKEELSIERSVAERALKLSTSFKPDAAARERAISDLVAFSKRPNALDPEVLFAVIALAGARESLRDHRELASLARNQNIVLTSMIALADLDGARSYAKSPPPLVAEDYDARDYYLRRGTWLCLIGERDAGLGVLKDAERINAKHHNFPFYEARVARAACGDSLAPGGDDLDRDAIWSYELGGRLAGADLDDKLIGTWSATKTIRDGSESPFVAAAIVDHERPLEETLSLLGALSKFPAIGMSLSPWAPTSASAGWLSSYPLLLDPERHEKASARLIELAKTAPKAQQPLRESQRGERWMPVATEKRYWVIRREPATALVHYAAGFELEAAAAWAAQGDCERAAKGVERALTLANTADNALFASMTAARCERYDRAKEHVRKGLSTATPGLTQALLWSLEADLLAHDGKFAEALAKAREANQLSDKLGEKTLLNPAVPVWVGTNWMSLAFGLKVGDLSSAPELIVPGLEERDKIPWQRLITMPEHERAAIRWRLRGQEPNHAGFGLPAQMLVVAEAVRGAGDPEVWLDLELGLFNRSLGSIAGTRARAEAARWRGDAKAEELHLSRARTLEKLLSDPRKRALGSLLGL